MRLAFRLGGFEGAAGVEAAAFDELGRDSRLSTGLLSAAGGVGGGASSERMFIMDIGLVFRSGGGGGGAAVVESVLVVCE